MTDGLSFARIRSPGQVDPVANRGQDNRCCRLRSQNGERSSRITSRRWARWISSPYRPSLLAACSSSSSFSITVGGSFISTSRRAPGRRFRWNVHGWQPSRTVGPITPESSRQRPATSIRAGFGEGQGNADANCREESGEQSRARGNQRGLNEVSGRSGCSRSRRSKVERRATRPAGSTARLCSASRARLRCGR